MKFNHTAHKGVWVWLSENPNKKKGDWPGWDKNGGDFFEEEIYAECFACQYTEELNVQCNNCPLAWPTEVCLDGGLFELWNETINLKEKSLLALQIANLPVREGVETE